MSQAKEMVRILTSIQKINRLAITPIGSHSSYLIREMNAHILKF